MSQRKRGRKKPFGDLKSPLFTGEGMMAHLHAVKIVGRALPPTVDACNRLVGCVHELAMTAHLPDETDAAHDARAEQITKALRSLADALPPARKGLSTDSLNRLSEAVNAALAEQPPWMTPRRYPECWHDIAVDLATAFCGAMRSTNAREFGLSNAGPVVRFVTTVIPAVTEERPSLDAVARYLQRHIPNGNTAPTGGVTR